MARDTRQTENTELTSGQLVIMICVALFLAAFFFALGQLVARIDFAGQPTTSGDRGNETAAAETAPSPASPAEAFKTRVAKGPMEVYVLPVSETASSVSAQTARASSAPAGELSPAQPDIAVPAAASSASSSAAASRPLGVSPPASTGKMLLPPGRQEYPVPPSPDTVIRETVGKRRLTEIPPLPSPHRVTPPPPPGASPPAEPIQPILPPAESVAKTAPVSHAAEPAESSASRSTPAAASSKPGPTPGPSTESGTASKGSASAPGSSDKRAVSGKFGVQLASFTGSQAEVKAEQFLKKVEKQLNLSLTILKSSDGKYYRVVVTGYADRAAASEACARIRKTAGLSEAFVRPLD